MEKKELSKVKILNKIKQFEKNNQVCSTEFLDPLDVIETQELYKNYEHVLYGGFEEAERKILILGTENKEEFENFVTVFEIISQKPLSHRAVLGSVLGLGIRREVIGDILIQENKADVFVLKEIAKYIDNNLDKVGSEKVRVIKISKNELLQPEDMSKIISTTVASLRLDAVISACYGISRELSSELIANEKVKLNYKVVSNVSKQIHEQDLISVRGFGRFIIHKIIGETRKGRIRVELKSQRKCLIIYKFLAVLDINHSKNLLR